MDGGRTGARSITDRSDLNRRYDANLFLPNPSFRSPGRQRRRPGLSCGWFGSVWLLHLTSSAGRSACMKDTAMIYSTIEKRNGEYVLVISEEDMESHNGRLATRLETWLREKTVPRSSQS